MRLFSSLLLILILTILSCKTKTPPNHSGKIIYSEQQLLSFLDSLGNIDNTQMKKDIAFYADSVFKSCKDLDVQISAVDFKKLKLALEEQYTDDVFVGHLSLIDAKRIFPFPIDTNLMDGSGVPIYMHLSENNKEKFNEFAICIGEENITSDNDVYFFKENKIISYHRIHHKGGFGLEGYADTDGKTMFNYIYNYTGGSGVWQYHNFFYKYNGDKLIPVLNFLQNGNLTGWSPKSTWLEALPLPSNPLKMKLNYSISIRDTMNNDAVIVKDSTLLGFKWDDTKKEYLAKYDSIFTDDELYCYYVDAPDTYFINVYYQKLKAIVNSNDEMNKEIILSYLANVKNNLKTQN